MQTFSVYLDHFKNFKAPAAFVYGLLKRHSTDNVSTLLKSKICSMLDISSPTCKKAFDLLWSEEIIKPLKNNSWKILQEAGGKSKQFFNFRIDKVSTLHLSNAFIMVYILWLFNGKDSFLLNIDRTSRKLGITKSAFYHIAHRNFKSLGLFSVERAGHKIYITRNAEQKFEQDIYLNMVCGTPIYNYPGANKRAQALIRRAPSVFKSKD